MAKETEFDLIILGAGPGGYVASIRAAQLGFKVACVEKRTTPGGTCLHVGCIPSKALLHASENFEKASAGHLEQLGIELGTVSLNLDKMMARKKKIVTTLSKGVAFLLKKNKVDFFQGTARIDAPGRVVVKNEAGEETVLAGKNILIATGSESTPLRGVEIDEKKIVTSTGALSFDNVPEHLIVVGAGVIGLELGSVWNRLGAKVTVVEFSDRILPGADAEIAQTFQKLLEKQGLSFRLGHKVEKAQSSAKNVAVEISPAGGGPAEKLSADRVLVAIGRRPFTEGLGLEALGVETDAGGRVTVDGAFASNIAGIYAIGDAISGPMLAHKAEEEGVAAVEGLAGQKPVIDHNTIPSIIYTEPEVAWVGHNEEELKAQNKEYKVGKFPLKANSRAMTNDCPEGFVKILASADTGKLFGAHIIAHEAGTLIQEAVSVMAWGGNGEDIARVCHGHPTLNEAVKEAALALGDGAIHM